MNTPGDYKATMNLPKTAFPMKADQSQQFVRTIEIKDRTGRVIGTKGPGLIFLIAVKDRDMFILGQVLSIREKEYVEAARSLGATEMQSPGSRPCFRWSPIWA